MRIYLDMCCYNRPYDPQDQLKITMETRSKLHIQRMVQDREWELIGSYTLDYECGNIPFPMRKRAIIDFIEKNISGYVGIERDDIISKKADKIMLSSRMRIMLPLQFTRNVITLYLLIPVFLNIKQMKLKW